MIAALWHRWFDAREHRAARERAEQNYSAALVRELALKAENTRLLRANARLAVDGDAAAADRAEALEERAVNAERALADSKQRVRDLERQLDELTLAKLAEHRVLDQHAQVSALPPALTRDRQALSRLEDELAAAREQIEKCGREHR